MKNKEVYKVIIAGEGGQGVQALAHAFSKAAFQKGLHVAYMPNYGVEQRGGVSLGYLQFGKGIIGFPKFQTADIVVVMCQRAVDRIKQYLGDETLVIFDASQIDASSLDDFYTEKLPINATEMATQKLTPKVANMVMAGALISEVSGITPMDLEKSFETLFGDKYKKKPELRHLNNKALELGVRIARSAYAVE